MKSITTFLWIFISSVSYSQANFRIQTLNFNAEATNPILANHRYGILKDYIRSKDIDVLLMQEDWSFLKVANVSQQIARDLNYDQVYHFEDGVTGFYETSTSIMSKKSLHFRNSAAVKLPHSAFTIGDGIHDWVSFGATNILIGGTIDLPDGTPATVWTTHLATHSHSYRADQIAFMFDYIKDYIFKNRLDFQNTPIFIGGDMNSYANSPEARSFKTNGFVDAWPVAHPDDPGFTLINSPLDPFYNPMVHSAGEFPEQYDEQGNGRIDFIYFKNLSNIGVGAERIFTGPQGRIWMSDHFSVLAQFNFDGSLPSLPSADSLPSDNPAVAYLNVDEGFAKEHSSNLDLDVDSLRGLVVANNLPKVRVEFEILNHHHEVYNTHHAALTTGQVSSFSFFSPGNYQFQLKYKNSLDENSEQKVRGTLHVK